MSWTPVGDEFVKSIQGCRELSVLWMTGTQLTDKSVDVLIQLQGLESLDVQRNSDQSRWIGSNQESPSSVAIESTGAAITLNADKSLPSFFAVTQDFPRKVVEDVEAVIANTLFVTHNRRKN